MTDHPDTPERCHLHDNPDMSVRCAEHDAPEGGQPDTDDELLARAEREAEMIGDAGMWGASEFITDLASALRRKRDELDEERKVANAGWQEFSVAHKDIERLERELTKAREGRDDWRRIAQDNERGTVTVTDGMLDDWIAALRSGNAIVFGPPQANGLADRLAEARSHGEVLATGTIDDTEDGFLAIDIGLSFPAISRGERVLVVRATADQEETE